MGQLMPNAALRGGQRQGTGTWLKGQVGSRAPLGGLCWLPWVGSGAHLPAALAGLLLEAQAPALRARLPAMVHSKDDRPGEQDSGGPAANDGTQQGLTAG